MAAIREEWPEERASLPLHVEWLLQVPGLLDKHRATAGIENGCLVSEAYFYLSAVKKLKKDKWQVAMHFLQAHMVSPRMAQEVLAPDLSEFLLPSAVASEEQSLKAMEEVARKYKGWLMYYQVMLHGDTPQWWLLLDEADFFV